MRTAITAVIVFGTVVTGAQAAEATFLGGATYATPSGCAKLAKLASGTPRNLNSVPETLTAKGYESWEGGCSIEKVTTRAIGKNWIVSLSCSEGAEENVKSTETWTRRSDGSLLINAQGKKTRFVACTAPAPKN